MNKHKLTNKATEDLTLIWDYTFEVGLKNKLINTIMN